MFTYRYYYYVLYYRSWWVSLLDSLKVYTVYSK
jgi:hypothetical protein